MNKQVTKEARSMGTKITVQPTKLHLTNYIYLIIFWGMVELINVEMFSESFIIQLKL